MMKDGLLNKVQKNTPAPLFGKSVQKYQYYKHDFYT